MPIPAYILCSQSAAVDSTTRQVSLFHLIDTVSVLKSPDGQPPTNAAILPFTVTAAWVAIPGQDSDTDKFEYQIVARYPGADDLTIKDGEFSFPKPIHRVKVAGAFGAFPGLGIMHIVSRIRRAGGNDWIESSYPVIVVEKATTSAPE